jgi:phosphopantetheinyl transferase
MRLLAPDFVLAIAPLDSVLASMPEPAEWLSSSELDRGRQLRVVTRHDEFLAGRWLLRGLLAERFGGVASDWPIAHCANAAPRPMRGDGFARLSIAHAGGFVAVAAAMNAIGVDIEASTRQLPAEIFDPLLGYIGADPQDRLQHWVATEAWLKAQGFAALPEQLAAYRLRPTADAAPQVRAYRYADYVFAIAADAAVLDHAELRHGSAWSKAAG